MQRTLLGFLACFVALGLSSNLMAEDPAPKTQETTTQPRKASDDQRVMAAKTFRSSQLSGMTVRNSKGEEIGTVNDLVIDLRNGKVQYAAMSVGGLLGVGNKLFAVPFDELKFDHGQEEKFFVLDIAPEKIAAAPGFDKNHWPDFADPNFISKIENHYRKTEVRTGDQNPARPRRTEEPKNN